MQGLGAAISGAADDRARQDLADKEKRDNELEQQKAREKARQEKIQRFGALRQEAEWETELSAEVTELKRNARPDGLGTAKAVEQHWTKREAQFLANVPEPMRDEFRARLAGTKQRFMGDALDFEYTAGDNFFRTGLNDSYEKARKFVSESPDNVQEAAASLRETIDASDLPAPEKMALAQKMENGLAAVVYKRKAEEALRLPDMTIADDVGSTTAVLRAMEMVESSGDPNAVSSKGARGLMQVMPETAAEIAEEIGDADFPRTGAADVAKYLSKPEVSRRYGKHYFEKQLTAFGGDVETALVAYNAGPGVAQDYVASGRNKNILPAETQGYIKKVLGAVEGDTDVTMPERARTVLTAALAGGKEASHIDEMAAPFASSLAAMIEAAPPEIRKQLTINSGARSNERQAELFAAAVKKYGSEKAARKWVAPPGKSQHNHGTAADLGFGSKAAEQWVHANAEKFGLHFRMGHEPWHIELAAPVGNKEARLRELRNDPLYENLPIEDIDVMEADAGRLVDAENAESTRLALAEQKAQVNTLLMRLATDPTSGEADILAALKANIIKDVDDLTKARGIVKSRDEEQKDAKFVQGILDGTSGDVYNPTAHNDSFNKWVGQPGLQAIQSGDQEYINSQLLPAVAKFQDIPTQVVGQLTAMTRSQDVAQQEFAYRTLAAMDEQVPQVFRARTDDDLATKVNLFRAMEGLVPPEERAAFLRGGRTAAEVSASAALDKEAAAITTSKDFKPLQTVRAEFDKTFAYDAPREDSYVAAQVELERDFITQFRLGYRATRDEKAAKEFALTQLKQLWGVTDVGTPYTLMKLPPERIYPAINGGHETYQDQLAQDLGVLPNQTVELVSDEITLQEYNQRQALGRLPSYLVRRTTVEGGRTTTVTLPQRWYGEAE